MGQKRWEVIKLLTDDHLQMGRRTVTTYPYSVRLDGKELYILSHLERAQAGQIERMLNSLNSIVASHATIG